MTHIYSFQLSETQLTEIEQQANDTLPQGQTVFINLETNAIVSIANDRLPLFEQQNAAAISSGTIAKIIFEG